MDLNAELIESPKENQNSFKDIYEYNKNILPMNISKIFITSKYRESITSIRKQANMLCRN